MDEISNRKPDVLKGDNQPARSATTFANGSGLLSVENQIGDVLELDEEKLHAKRIETERRYIELLEQRIARLESTPLRRRRFSSGASSISEDLAQEDETGSDSPIPENTACHNGQPLFVERRFALENDKYEEKTLDEEAVTEEKRDIDLDHPFRWKRITGPYGPEGSEVTINCPRLKSLLASELINYPVHFGTARMRFSSPFLPLIHNWESLQKKADEVAAEEDPCQSHLKRLLGVVRKSKDLRSYFDNLKQNLSDRVVSFNDLEKIFPPGELAYATPLGAPQAFLVHRTSAFPPNRPVELLLYCWTYNFDGKDFTREPFKFIINHYDGTKRITSLRCYPLKYHEKGDIRSELKERGENFREYSIQEHAQRMFDYDGEMYFTSNKPDDLYGDYGGQVVMASVIVAGILENGYKERERLDDMDRAEAVEARSKVFPYHGRAMIDAASYSLYGPEWPPAFVSTRRSDEYVECECSKCQGNIGLQQRIKTGYDKFGKDISGKWRQFLDDEQYIICPPRIKGYALFKKMWVQMDVTKVKELEESKLRNETAFDKLVLPSSGDWKGIKVLMAKLVQFHANHSTPKRVGVPGQLRDLVVGKGQGLVILLHGASGNGKTLTAESVAEYTGKPLLKVSVADIGLDVTKVEKKLEQFFQLATRWEAILLFDEADILLESRKFSATAGGLERNSIVSVFLKILEYYEGILLLTTNRMKTFDVAVQSRIHLALNFPSMVEEDQKSVIRMFLKDIDPADKADNDIQNWLDNNYTNARFNGRQLRNVLASAMDVARAEDRRLKYEDIKNMWERTKRFEDSMHDWVVANESGNLIRVE